MDIAKLGPKAINSAIEVLSNGGVVIFPTDTVYGFLADASNKKAVEKIFKIKKRPKSKPLAVFVKDLKMAKQLAEIFSDQEKIIKKHWPGRHTFILFRRHCEEPAGDVAIQSVCIKQGKIGLRIPDYKPLNLLLEKINRPLAQTSVNISGKPELNKISEIIETFQNLKNQPDLIVDAGNLPKRKPSKVIVLTGDKLTILR
jgi:L-threonylcarbamoyladenylate synthase